ncbi:MAG: hypothetical protein MI808_21985 [Pseudomonadales bacterium]|nr:hypothetical protein [Pseudomonadales bacterium]
MNPPNDTLERANGLDNVFNAALNHLRLVPALPTESHIRQAVIRHANRQKVALSAGDLAFLVDH